MATEETTEGEATHPAADTAPRATKLAVEAPEEIVVGTVAVIEGDIEEVTEEGIVVAETEGVSEEATVVGSAEGIAGTEVEVVEDAEGALSHLHFSVSGLIDVPIACSHPTAPLTSTSA